MEARDTPHHREERGLYGADLELLFNKNTYLGIHSDLKEVLFATISNFICVTWPL